jgi:hypothetical protein
MKTCVQLCLLVALVGGCPAAENPTLEGHTTQGDATSDPAGGNDTATTGSPGASGMIPGTATAATTGATTAGPTTASATTAASDGAGTDGIECPQPPGTDDGCMGSGGSDGCDDPGPLITTGHDFAQEWDLTVRHTLDGRGLTEGTYLATVALEPEFDVVIAVPSGGGGTSYYRPDGWSRDGSTVTIFGTLETLESISVHGTVVVTDQQITGSGTFHDGPNCDDPQVGTWEILDAVPL